jgi:hypothetical protein
LKSGKARSCCPFYTDRSVLFLFFLSGCEFCLHFYYQNENPGVYRITDISSARTFHFHTGNGKYAIPGKIKYAVMQEFLPLEGKKALQTYFSVAGAKTGVSQPPMIPQPYNEPFETAVSIFWFDKEGIFCSYTKKGMKPTRETLRQTFDYIRANSPGKLVCWLGDVTEAAAADKETRDFAAEETPKLIKALALITKSSFSKMFANLFLAIKSPAYPVKMFTDETEARAWLRKFME